MENGREELYIPGIVSFCVLQEQLGHGRMEVREATGLEASAAAETALA